MLVLTLQSLPFLGLTSYGQTTSTSKDSVNGDSSAIVADSLKLSDSLAVKDSVKTDSIPQSDIETTILYSAEDSISMDIVNKIVYLYGKAKINYGDISLEAENININWETNILTAYPGLDSTGKKFGVPIFKDGNDVFTVDTIRYNAKTKKGLIKGIVTKQGEGYVHGEKVKKIEDNLYINNAKYTTCDLAHPHFYIHANKLKVIPNEKVVSGPFNMVISDVPTPLGFILGYFPMPKKRKSGLIIPTIGSTAQRGFSLRQGGYYWAANDYLGVQVIGDAYANQSYRGTLSGNYIKRYIYQGMFAFNTSRTKNSFDNDSIDPPFKDFNFQWNHRSLRKRNSNFQANVNAGSQRYFQRNSYNPTAVQQGTFSSAIMYYKAFGNSPFNINIALRQNQSRSTGVMNFYLPDMNVNMNRIFPFKNSRFTSKGVGNLLLNNFSLQYNGQAQFFMTNDSTKTGLTRTIPFNAKNLDTLFSRGKYGAKHSIPIGTTIKFKKTFLKNFNFSPTFTFEDLMYQADSFDTKTKKIVNTNQFKNAYSYNGTIQVNTNIYGMYKFKGKRLVGLRHTLNPSVYYTYKPDFSNQFQRIDTAANRTDYFAPFINAPYSGPSRELSSAVGFQINNILEGKSRSKSDSVSEFKKFKIIDQLNLSGNYDFAKKSFNLSNLNVSFRSRIANRIDIYGTGTFDPYAYKDSIINGRLTKMRYNSYAITAKQGLAQLINYNLSVGTSLNPAANKKKYKSTKADANELAQINANPQAYVDFNIPWNLTVNYNLSVTKNFIVNDPNFITQAFTFNGEVKLTEKWKVGFNSGYNIQEKAMTTTRVDIFRDLHCWQMALNLVPFGTYKSYGFTINAKSSILQDLKLTKRNATYFGGYY